ncbi:MAG TPA: DegV family protein [Clostridiales bacterium]|nr:DegV family protein [Clostridiales bacterium]
MIRLITDSTVYLRRDEAGQLGIRIVPIGYSMGGCLYSEYYSDDDAFEEYLASGGSITTSQPSPAVFSGIFREELLRGGEVLCITLSSRLSGIYNSAALAAKQVGDRVHVFDSRLTAGGLYLLVRRARELADRGLKICEILADLERLRERITVCFSVGDMAPLRRSGRVGFVRMSVGTILNSKPILLLRDGAVVQDSVAHGTKEIIRVLTDKIPKGASEVIINYISNNQVVSNLYNVIKKEHPQIAIRLSKLGPVLSAHLGLNVVAVSC